MSGATPFDAPHSIAAAVSEELDFLAQLRHARAELRSIGHAQAESRKAQVLVADRVSAQGTTILTLAGDVNRLANAATHHGLTLERLDRNLQAIARALHLEPEVANG